MKVLKIFIILFVVANFSELKSTEANDILKNKILKNIRCLICQGQSVYDSESEFASSIKLIVDRKINEGLKEKQIYQFLREKYGVFLLFVCEDYLRLTLSFYSSSLCLLINDI